MQIYMKMPPSAHCAIARTTKPSPPDFPDCVPCPFHHSLVHVHVQIAASTTGRGER